jgi:hypothetical protein
MSDALFGRLRELAWATIGDNADSTIRDSDLVPIEQTQDGWFCLLRGGQVVHVETAGKRREIVEARDRATALVGSLARRFPLATWFVPRAEHVDLCPSCHGSGIAPGVPAPLQAQIVCRCGGLGWVPTQ